MHWPRDSRRFHGDVADGPGEALGDPRGHLSIDEPWRPERISGSIRGAVDAPVTMLERIDDAIFSLNVAFDRAGENFEMLRCGVTFTESHSEHDQRPGR
jgi:hypothetical protein